MNRRTLTATLLSAILAACELGGSTTSSAGSASCTPVQSACAQNSDCCSYACMGGFCIPNPIVGGACRTSDDCDDFRLCKSSACATPTLGMCRDDADVCSFRSQCCSGNCLGGHCTLNRPPVASAGPDVADAPYTKVFTLTNASTDPDGDPLTYGWSLVSAPPGSAAALSSPTAAAPSFTPDKVGAYVVRLVVTDGPAGTPNRLTVEDSVTITAVNRAPVVTATAPSATASRNIQITISSSASDPDGDTLECAWRVTAPGEATPTEVVPFAACANPNSGQTLPFTPQLEGPYLIERVVRDHDRTTNAVVNTTVAAVSLTAVNDPPVPAVSRSPYYGNLGATAGETPQVALDASSSTDPNGDHLGTPGLSFFWEMVSASDGGTVPALTGFATSTPTFVPERAVDYVLRLTVTDPAQFARAGASSTLLVTVKVGRYIQQLAHDVVDAAYAKTADKIVTAGHDPSDPTKGMIWVYDVATGTEGAGIRLVDPGDPTASGIPKLVGVTPDGGKAVVADKVGEGVSAWIVTLGGTPNITRLTRPFDVGELVVAGGRYVYFFSTGASDAVRQLDLTNGTMSAPFGTYGYGTHGAASSGAATPYLYRIDPSWGDLYKYRVDNNGLTQITYANAPTCGGYYSYASIWATLNNQYLVTSCGDVYNASTLASLGQSLPFLPSYVDSVAAGTVLAVDGGRPALELFNSTLQPAGTDLVPRWAQDGYGRTASVKRAFLNGAATKRIAVVSDTASPTRYGVLTFP